MRLISGSTRRDKTITYEVAILVAGLLLFFAVIAAFNSDPASASLGGDGPISPTGTINSTSSVISAYAGSDAAGIDIGSWVVKLDGVTLTTCTATGYNYDYFLGYTRGSISCPVSGLSPGTHSIFMSISDWDGTVMTDSATFTVVNACTPDKPSLGVGVSGAYWGSYADYLTRDLSVRMAVTNKGSGTAYSGAITGSTGNNGVARLSGMPIQLGDIAGSGSTTATIMYHIPSGVGGFSADVTGSASDACGTSYTYPV